jgi:hypothetical protein
MKKPKTKLNRRQRRVRSRARNDAGIPAKPAAKRKPKTISATRQVKLKKSSPAPGACLASAQPLPEFAAVERRPYLAPRHHYFLGGGTAKPAGYLPDGFVLASEPKPADYCAAEFRSFRTFPEGEFIRCVRYELNPAIVAQMREHAERVRKEIALDDGNARARKDLALLVAKNRRNEQPTRLFYK